jgi:hypothetical protein
MAEIIRKNLSEMTSLFSDHSFRMQYYHSMSRDDNELVSEVNEIRGQDEEQFQGLAQRVFKSGKVFFELYGLHEHREEFIVELSPILKDKNKLLKGTYSEEVGEAFSVTIEAFWTYFLPFPEFIDVEEIERLKISGISYLETILGNTSNILTEMEVIPENESDIYNAVRIVLTSTFPHYKEPDFIFMKSAKCYKPDILLPGLQCAIEYKFSETEKELNQMMDEILIDVEGYSKHPNYNRFYAVFYVKAGTINKSRFEVLWEEKEFPHNWQPIFIEGL